MIIALIIQTGKKLSSVKGHKSQINDMQFNKDGTMFVTASKDHTAKLFDSESLMLLKTYKTERPVNSATISPIFDHVSLIYSKISSIISSLLWFYVYIMLQLLNVQCISLFLSVGGSWRWSGRHGRNHDVRATRQI